MDYLFAFFDVFGLFASSEDSSAHSRGLESSVGVGPISIGVGPIS